jgi:hypothetical protein
VRENHRGKYDYTKMPASMIFVLIF